jgi:dihydrofolate reductase
MRTLAVNAFVTLDGVMQGPGGPDEDRAGGFAHGGWSAGYWDEAMGHHMDGIVDRPFDMLLGRKTYEIFAAHWPYVPERLPADDPQQSMAAALNGAKKYVASRTLSRVDWQQSTLLSGDVARQVKELKARPGPEIQVHGSAHLIQTLLAHDLVDELRLLIFPVLVGDGKRLFGEGTVPGGLALASSKTFSTGVVLAIYRRAGAIKVGSFEFDQPTDEELQRRKRTS